MKISISTPIYNNNSIKQILSLLPENMAKVHRNEYINNCILVYKSEVNKVNLGFAECARNTNFNLIQFYNNL